MADGDAQRSGALLTPEAEKARRARNRAIALGLSLFIILVFAVTIFRLGGNVASRPF